MLDTVYTHIDGPISHRSGLRVEPSGVGRRPPVSQYLGPSHCTEERWSSGTVLTLNGAGQPTDINRRGANLTDDARSSLLRRSEKKRPTVLSDRHD